MGKILLIDDNRAYCEQLKKTLELYDIELLYVTDGNSGIQQAVENHWEVILLDVVLNQKIDGLQILKEIIRIKPQMPVIMVSGASTLHTAVEATKIGAYDFLEKPIDIERLLITLRRAIEKNQLANFRDSFFQEINQKIKIVGKSEVIRRVLQEIGNIAHTDAKVFISGESGSGKDVIAKTIHYKSNRATHPFIQINCGAIPDSLFESELFGYIKGAFTGADHNHRGLIARAEYGTLYLDEITELSVSMQAKLLKFLQDDEYSPIGSNDSIKAQVRIIASSNIDIRKAISQGKLRDDLYYRLNIFHIHIPPLQKRPEDIPILAEYFLQRGCKKFGKQIPHFSDDALALIKKQQWRGNVRQLKSAVYRMILLANDKLIDYGTAATAIQMDRTTETVITAESYREAFDEFERLFFVNKLKIYDNNRDAVAKASGMSLENLEEKLRRLKIGKIKERG